MTFKHISRVLLAAFGSLFLANVAFANSVSPIPVYNTQTIESGANPTTPLCDSCGNMMHWGKTRSEMASPYFQGMVSSSFDSAMTFDRNAANASSVYADSQLYPLFDTNRGGAKESTFYYPVAEPGTLTLFGTGLVFLAGVIRRKVAKA